MSSLSQTPTRKPALLNRGGFGIRFALSMAVATALVALAMSNVLQPILRVASQARVHAPDLNLLLALSPVIKVHLAGALLAIILGGVLMTVRKGRRFHRVAGWVWVSTVSVSVGATLFIRELNHGSWSLLHLFTGWTLIVLPLGVAWAKRHDVRRHSRTMMGLFYGGFAINLAFAFIPGRTLWMVFFG
ncbi:hypothetical protein [uncultured Phenylobacterium sp.]|uniref:DUF2306 domain-containing protein n=1 Tax=uncultured Phenylobacterium sp. TaxID=349273 RepID=UPI0025E9CE03|nr:hypothetical protein [uncultured Phenylobacterium sp.]